MKTDSIVTNLVRQQRRRMRGTTLVWSLAFALVAHAWAGAERLGLLARHELWPLIPAGVSGGLLVAWLRRARGITDASVARELDTRRQLRARLESAIELAREESVVAAAQRVETAQQIEGQQPTGALAWRSGIALALVALVFLGAESVVVMHRIWRLHAVAKVQEKKAIEVRASIDWKSPENAIVASAIEEVPLLAYAASNTGFRALSLEVAVNGKHVLSQPIDVTKLAQPGANEVGVSLVLDDLHVKALDVVSYHLVGTPISASPTPAVVSPLQMLQIRQPRRDPTPGEGGDPTLISMIRQMKGIQMTLLQENFTLLHADELKQKAEWKTENARVAAEESALAGQADQALALANQQRAPALAVNNLTEAEKLMKAAGGSLAAEKNDPAAETQGRVIALLAEIEKLISPATRGAPASADPFHDRQKVEVPKREATPAGELEKLAQRQRQNNQSFPGSPGSAAAADGPSPGADEQAAIARDAEKLGQGGGFDPETQKALAEAAASAAQAAKQLQLNDGQAAREPAATAEAAFDRALAAQERAGRAAALESLEQVRRELNAASREDAAARALSLARVRDELRTAAADQQQGGSAEAARQLASLANASTAAQGAAAGPTAGAPDSAERARALATDGARVQISLSPKPAALNRVVRQIRRISPGTGGGSGQAAGAEALANAELASQAAEWLTADAATTELARKLSAQLDGWQREAGNPGAEGVRTALENAEKLASALEKIRDQSPRDEIVRRFSAEDIDPVYRAAVEAYFERLSREGSKRD